MPQRKYRRLVSADDIELIVFTCQLTQLAGYQHRQRRQRDDTQLHWALIECLSCRGGGGGGGGVDKVGVFCYHPARQCYSAHRTVSRHRPWEQIFVVDECSVMKAVKWHGKCARVILAGGHQYSFKFRV